MASNTQQAIIDAAFEIILKKGFPATTVDEICEAAGVSKGSFYHSFKTKEDMGLAVLTDFYKTAQNNVFGAPWALEADPADRLLGLLEHSRRKADDFWGKGCLLGGFAIDVAETNPTLQARISRIFDEIGRSLAPVFEVAAREGGPTSEDLARQYLSTIEGAIVLAKAHQDPEYIRQALGTFTDYVERLLERTPAR